MNCNLTQEEIDEILRQAIMPKKYCGESLNAAIKKHCHPLVLEQMFKKPKRSRKATTSIVCIISKLISECFQQLTLVTGWKSIMILSRTQDMKTKNLRAERTTTATTGSPITFTIRIWAKGILVMRPLRRPVVKSLAILKPSHNFVQGDRKLSANCLKILCEKAPLE